MIMMVGFLNASGKVNYSLWEEAPRSNYLASKIKGT